MPTVRRCCILGCPSNSKDDIDLQFFQFPKRENPLYQLWAEACHVSMRRIMPLKKPIMCSLHFHRNAIGGRRLTSTAVPTLLLSPPDTLARQEEACMMVELERARKASYVEACVYEWLLRMNAAGNMRGSINYNTIKERAQMAKELINAEEFYSDNNWLHRFRKSHLIDFTRKVRESGILPCGTSQRMDDIVRDMEHMFPPTSSTQGYANIPSGYLDYSYGGSGTENFDGYDQPNGDEYHQRGGNAKLETKGFVFDEANRSTISSGSVGNLSETPFKKIKTESNGFDFNDEIGGAGELSEPPSKKIKTENRMSSPEDYSEHNEFTLNRAIGNNTSNHSNSPWPNQTYAISTYSEALEYLKPLEDFVLEKENYRAIGLISQLELVFKKMLPNTNEPKN